MFPSFLSPNPEGLVRWTAGSCGEDAGRALSKDWPRVSEVGFVQAAWSDQSNIADRFRQSRIFPS